MYQRPKGTRDIFGKELERLRAIEAFAIRFFKLNGYEEIRIPTFEANELFTRSIGETTDIVEKEMFTFQVADKLYCLRPEGTASALRAFIENRFSLPARLLYIGSMYRKERPQKGRYREFSQIGIELLGESLPFYDAQLIDEAIKFINSLGLKDFSIEINSIGCPRCRADYKNELRKYLKPSMKELCPDCQRRLDKNFLRVFDCKKESCQEIFDGAPKITDRLCPECAEHYRRTKDYLKKFNIAFFENKKLVRGLDYYTKTVFEFKHHSLGAQNTILAGGRYDLLMKELGGGDVPALGWAMGLDRLLLILPADLPRLEERLKFFIATIGERFIQEMIQTKKVIQENGFICLMGDPEDSIKHQLKRANRSNVDYVLIYGEDEAKKHIYTIKDMKTGEQKEIPSNEIKEFLKRT